MTTVVVSVRVRRELREEAERLGINIRKVLEKALEEEILRVRRERFKQVVKEGLEEFELSPEEWVRTVKELRRER